MANKFGATSWDDEPSARGKNSSDRVDLKDLFMKLNNGSNELRTMSRPYKYCIHKYKVEGMAGFGVKIGCAGEDENGVNICPLCQKAKEEERQDLEMQERWYVLVFSRSEKRTKILDIGRGVYKDIKKLNDNPRWGNPELYDIEIVVNKKGAPAEYYKVNPLPPNPSPLTEEELAMKKEFDLDLLSRLCAPLKPEKVLEKMHAVEKSSNNAGKTASEGGDTKEKLSFGKA